jgi:outer membrane receptor protein involved in Fe transport
MFYLRVASGYRPGAPNFIDPQYPEIPPATKADTMIDYELGTRREFLDRRASADLTVFKQNLSNLKTTAITPDGAVVYGINAGSVTSKGLEVATLYTPANAWHLAFNAAYTDTYATEAVPSAGIAAGARMPTAPRWTASAIVDYRLNRLGQWTGVLTAGWRYTDKMYTAISSMPPVGVIPGYSSFDLGLQLTNSRLEISLYAKNVLDKRAYNSAAVQTNTVTGAHFFYGSLVRPQLIGLSLNVNLR